MPTTTTKLKNSQFAHFLNTTPTAQSATYSLINLGVSEYNINYNATTSSSQYIAEDTATSDTTSYAPSIDITQECYKNDPVYEYVFNILRNRYVLSDCYSQLINMYKHNPILSSGEETGEYEAELQNVSITVTSLGGSQPDAPTLNYSINYRGDSTKGKFNPTTGTFTAGTYSDGTFTPAST